MSRNFNLKEYSTSQLLDELRSRAEIISARIARRKTSINALSDTGKKLLITIPVDTEVLIVKPQNLE